MSNWPEVSLNPSKQVSELQPREHSGDGGEAAHAPAPFPLGSSAEALNRDISV